LPPVILRFTYVILRFTYVILRFAYVILSAAKDLRVWQAIPLAAEILRCAQDDMPGETLSISKTS